MGTAPHDPAALGRPAWNTGRQGDPLLPRPGEPAEDRALYDLAIDSKLRGCDFVTRPARTRCLGLRTTLWTVSL
jgi:hypothetical protein